MKIKIITLACMAILFTACTHSFRNGSDMKGADSLKIYFNYGESDPDTIVEWVFFKDRSLTKRIRFGGKYAGDSCKTLSIQGKTRQAIQQLAEKIYIDYTCKDVIRTKSSRITADCGGMYVEVYSPAKTIIYFYDFGYDVEYSKEFTELLKLTLPYQYTDK